MSDSKRLAFLIELPSYFTADIDDYRGSQSDFDSESDFLLNLCGEPGVVRVRMEISGEKDSTVVEVWGSVREARLIDASPEDEDGLAEHGSRLMRDEDSCEWCEFHERAERA